MAGAVGGRQHRGEGACVPAELRPCIARNSCTCKQRQLHNTMSGILWSYGYHLHGRLLAWDTFAQ